MHIKIPDKGKSHPMRYHDKVSFKFTKDDQSFSFDPSNGFKEPVPPGPYPKGKTIGPFTPTAPNVTVDFHYDNSDDPVRGMHSILIGN